VFKERRRISGASVIGVANGKPGIDPRHAADPESFLRLGESSETFSLEQDTKQATNTRDNENATVKQERLMACSNFPVNIIVCLLTGFAYLFFPLSLFTSCNLLLRSNVLPRNEYAFES